MSYSLLVYIVMFIWKLSSLKYNGSVTSHTISSVYIKQVGNNVDEHRRTECVSHVPAIKTFFKVKKKNPKNIAND